MIRAAVWSVPQADRRQATSASLGEVISESSTASRASFLRQNATGRP